MLGIWADGRGGTTRAHTGYLVGDQIIDVARADKNMDDEETSQTAWGHEAALATCKHQTTRDHLRQASV